MNVAKEFGNYIGTSIGSFDLIRRSQPTVYRNIMQIISTIFALIFINTIISNNISNDKSKNIPINHSQLLLKRLISIPMAIVVGWLIGFIAEMSVHAQLAQSRQNCLYKGFKPNTREFDLCVDNTNFHLQNKGDLIYNFY